MGGCGMGWGMLGEGEMDICGPLGLNCGWWLRPGDLAVEEA